MKSDSAVQTPNHRWPLAAVIVGMVVFALYFSWLSAMKAQVFDSHSLDLGNMWQSMWNVAHGHGFIFSNAENGQIVDRLGYHADYLLIILSPLTRLTDNPAILFWVQSAVGALGAWFVYRLARHWLRRPGLAAIFAIGYLFYGPLQNAVVWQFHAETLAVTFILAMIEALVTRRRPILFWLWFGLALISKEHVGFIAGPAAWYFGRQSGWGRRAWWPWIIGWTYSLLHFGLIIPAHSSTGHHFVLDFYFRSTDGSIHPFTYWSNVWQSQTARSILYLLSPGGLLALGSPVALGAVLALLPHWLSNDPGNHTIFFQNHVLAIPFIWAGTVLGWGYVHRRLRRLWSDRTATRFLTTWLIGWTIAGTLTVGPNPWSLSFNPQTVERNPNVAAVPAMKRLVPADASVSYSWSALSYWRDRVAAWPLPRGIGSSEYLVLVAPVAAQPSENLNRDAYIRSYLAQSSAFVKIYDDGHNQIYHRNTGRLLEPLDSGTLPPSARTP